MISSQAKFLVNHSFHVTQNKQFTGQPICDEIQSVIRFSFFLPFLTYFSSCQWYIIIDSIVYPSKVWNANFVVVSASTVSLHFKEIGKKSDFNSSFNWLDRVVISFRSICWFLNNSKKICFTLNCGILCSSARNSNFSWSNNTDITHKSEIIKSPKLKYISSYLKLNTKKIKFFWQNKRTYL